MTREPTDLERLAIRVRRAQIEYFAARTYAGLCKARDLEREFDREAVKTLGNAGEVHQPGSKERLL